MMLIYQPCLTSIQKSKCHKEGINFSTRFDEHASNLPLLQNMYSPLHQEKVTKNRKLEPAPL